MIKTKTLALIGKTFGKLTILSAVYNPDIRETMFFCRCDCGNEKFIRSTHIKKGRASSCGCFKKPAVQLYSQFIGMTISNLHILETVRKPNKDHIFFKYRCICGKVGTASVYSVIKGQVQSCGCLKASLISKNRARHGRSQTPEYRAWAKMKERCYYAKYNESEHYMGKGITVCDRWLHSFENFFADMGIKPSSKHSLGRIHNDKNYEPSNCAWQTPIEQANNKSNNHFETFNGEMLTVAQWARRLGITPSCLNARLQDMPVERALTISKRQTKASRL